MKERPKYTALRDTERAETQIDLEELKTAQFLRSDKNGVSHADGVLVKPNEIERR